MVFSAEKDLTVYRRPMKRKRKPIAPHYAPKHDTWYSVADLSPETRRRYLEVRYIGWRARYDDPVWIKQNRLTSLRTLHRKLGKVRQCKGECNSIKPFCDFDLLKAAHTTKALRTYCKLCRKKMNADAYQRKLKLISENKNELTRVH